MGEPEPFAAGLTMLEVCCIPVYDGLTKYSKN